MGLKWNRWGSRVLVEFRLESSGRSRGPSLPAPQKSTPPPTTITKFQISPHKTHLADSEIELPPALLALHAIHRRQNNAQSTSRLEVHKESHLKRKQTIKTPRFSSKHHKIYRKPSCHRRILSVFAQLRLLVLNELYDELRERLLRRRIGLDILQTPKERQNSKKTPKTTTIMATIFLIFPLTFLWFFCSHNRTLSKP
jgi:hypothetical protein